VVELLSKVIFCHLTSPKCDLDEVKKAMFHRPHFRALDQPKMRLGWGQKSNYSSGYKALWIHFLPLDQRKFRFGWSWKSDDSSCRITL